MIIYKTPQGLKSRQKLSTSFQWSSQVYDSYQQNPTRCHKSKKKSSTSFYRGSRVYNGDSQIPTRYQESTKVAYRLPMKFTSLLNQFTKPHKVSRVYKSWPQTSFDIHESQKVAHKPHREAQESLIVTHKTPHFMTNPEKVSRSFQWGWGIYNCDSQNPIKIKKSTKVTHKFVERITSRGWYLTKPHKVA